MPTCLFFDEMPVIQKIGERLLSQAGYETTVVDTIEACGAHLDANGCPDLVILSATGANSTIAETVKAAREKSKSMIVLVSVINRNIGALMRLRRAGANGILMKPFDADGFMDAITAHVRAAELAA